MMTEPHATLVQSAADGDRGAVLALLEAHADPNERDSDGETALLWAIARHDEKMVRALLDAGADPALPAWDNLGYAPVHAAVLAGPGLVRLLLRRGANPNASTRVDLETPLHVAARHGARDAAAALLDAGAQPWRADASGATPFSVARAGQRVEMVHLLQRAEGAVTADSARHGRDLHAEVVEGGPWCLSRAHLLLAAGANPNGWPGPAEPSCLAVAAARGDVDLVRALLEFGADWRALDTGGLTAAQGARRAGHDAVLALLIRWGGEAQLAQFASSSDSRRSPAAPPAPESFTREDVERHLASDARDGVAWGNRTNHIALWFYSQGEEHLWRGDEAAAGEALAQSAALFEELLAADRLRAPASVDVATSLNNLGNVYRFMGRLGVAAAYHEDAWHRRVVLLGPRDMATLQARSNLGEDLRVDGRTEEALDHALAVYADARYATRMAHVFFSAGISAQRLARVEQQAGSIARAVELFREAASFLEETAPGTLDHRIASRDLEAAEALLSPVGANLLL